MKRLISGFLPVCLTACVVLSGCGKSAEQKLLGKWEPDLSDAIKKAEEEAKEDPAAAMNLEMMKEAKVTIELKKEGKMAMSMGMGGFNINVEGKWKVTKDEGKKAKVELSFKPPGEEEEEKGEAEVTFKDADTIEVKPLGEDTDMLPGMGDGDQETMTLKRVKD
jgi:hypothetical protein